MDLLKYPIDKLFGLIASVIPGFVTLALFSITHPDAFSRVFSYKILGYKMTLFAVFMVAFITGASINVLFRMLVGIWGAWIGQRYAAQPYQSAHTFETAPWRDQVWRERVKKVLGESAPEDTLLMTEQAYTARLQLLENFQGDKQQQMSQLSRERLVSQINDGKWREWYDHYKTIVLNEGHRDFAGNIYQGFLGNMEASAFVGLIGLIAIPEARHWWVASVVFIWLLATIGDLAQGVKKATNIWGTLFEQTKYLSEIAQPAKKD